MRDLFRTGALDPLYEDLDIAVRSRYGTLGRDAVRTPADK
jgi:hypothetical protein